MSQTPQTDGKAPAQQMNGFADLYPRQVTPTTTIVLSLRNDDPTAYEVDIADLDCDCRDQAMNKDDPAVCDHIGVALYQSSHELNVDDALLTDLTRILSDLEDAASQAEDAAGALEGDLIDQRDAEAEDAAEAAGETSETDPVDGIKRALSDGGIDPANVDAWIDDDFGSLQFEPDDMPQDDFDVLRNWCQDVPWVNWDRDESRNFVKEEDFGRIV